MTAIADEYTVLLEFLYAAPVGLVQSTMDGKITLINSMSAKLLLPLSRDGRLSNLYSVLESVAPELKTLTHRFDAAHGLVCDGLRLTFDALAQGRSGPCFLSLNLLKVDEDRLIAVITDVTQQTLREQQMRQNEAWANAVLTSISDHAAGRIDARGIIRDWHSSHGHVLGFTQDGVVGQPYSIFYPDGAITSDRLLDRLHEADRSGWSLDEGWRIGAAGQRFWGSVMIMPVGAAPACDRIYSLVIRDITEQREASELRRLASASDHLTGIANRRTFFDAAALEFERWRRTPRPLSIILFDIDYFKRVNDTHGHGAGDAVLRHFASLLSATFRQIDVVARVGGEEFAVLLPSTDLEAAEVSANRLRQWFAAESIGVDGVLIACTVSGGVATVDDSTGDIAALMKRADRALYAAKGAGRNRIERQSDD